MPATPPPSQLAAVTVEDMFAAMALLGHPVEWRSTERAEPDETDVPVLLGALTAAVERLAVQREVPAALLGRRAWAAGYLQQAGGAAGPCGARGAFDMITLRLQGTAHLLEGYEGAGPMADLVRACVDAAAKCALLPTTAHTATGGGIDRRDPEITEVMHRRLADAAHAISGASALMRRVLATIGGRR